MEYDDIVSMLEEMGIPVAYWCFSEDDVPPLPFLVFSIPEDSVFYADGKKYIKKCKLYIELYVEEKSVELEQKLENILQQYGINAERQEQYLQDEKMFVEVYSTEV